MRFIYNIMNLITLFFKHTFNLIRIFTLYFIIQLPLKILGLIIIPIGLLFKRKHILTEENNPDSNFIGTETIYLPKMLWIWDNDRVGAWGDSGWRKEVKPGKYKSFLSMYEWLAIRNPINNLSRYMGARPGEVVEKINYFGNVKNPYYYKSRSPYLFNFMYCEVFTQERTYVCYYLIINYNKSKLLRKIKYTNDKCFKLLLGWKTYKIHNVGDKFEEINLTVTGTLFKNMK